MTNWAKRCIALTTIIILMFALSGCKDKTPTLTLEGSDTVEIALGDPYPEYGYHAEDYEGNDITGKVSFEMPDMMTVGDQYVKYSVTSHGKTVTESRILKIRHKPAPILESYEQYDTYEDYMAAYESYYAHYNKGIPIMMYHYVYDPADPPENLNANYISTTDLESHLQYLVDEDYYFPTWKDIRDYVDGIIDLPEKSIVLTFDDGQKDFVKYGIPLLEEYDVKATSFVIASKNGEKMAAMDLHNVQLQSHSYDMHRGGGNIGHGGIFTALYYEDALADLQKSIEVLGNGDAFAYPFGDYTDYCMQTVADAGFYCGVTTVNGKVYPGDNPYCLNRMRVSLGNDLESFIGMIE